MKLSEITSSRKRVPLRVLVYGNAGVGKSTLASQAPAPVFLCAEEGVSHLDVQRFPAPERWQDVLDAIDQLTTEEHSFKTLVIDTLDWLEPLCWAHVCKLGGKPDIEAFGYGKGYVAAVDAWRVLLGRLERLQSKRGMHVVLLGHAAARDHKDPDLDSWKRWAPKLHSAAADLVCEWVEAVLYATHLAFAKKDGLKTRGVSTGERVLYTEWTPGHVAKNRWGLPPQIRLGWADLYAGSRGAGALVEEIAALVTKLPEEKRPAVEAAVTDAGTDPVKLLAVLNRLRKSV